MRLACSFEAEVGLTSLPEMLFLGNEMRLSHAASGFAIAFNARDALRGVSLTADPNIVVAASSTWSSGYAPLVEFSHFDDISTVVILVDLNPLQITATRSIWKRSKAAAVLLHQTWPRSPRTGPTRLHTEAPSRTTRSPLLQRRRPRS